MRSPLFSDTALVYVERRQRAQSTATTIHFNWFEAAPEETYHIRTKSGIILELDSHLPVRPKSLSFTGLAAKDRAVLERKIERYVGADLARLMRSYPKRSFAVFIALSPSNRHSIALSQATSGNTPSLLRKACEAMLEEHHRAHQI
jgi:hypothetical protein